MSWKLIEVPDDEDDALSDSELIGINIILSDHMAEPLDRISEFRWPARSCIHYGRNVYYRAWRKLQPMTNTARKHEEE